MYGTQTTAAALAVAALLSFGAGYVAGDDSRQVAAQQERIESLEQSNRRLVQTLQDRPTRVKYRLLATRLNESIATSEACAASRDRLISRLYRTALIERDTGQGDADGDGHSNAYELLSGTDPLNASSVPASPITTQDSRVEPVDGPDGRAVCSGRVG